MCGRMCVRMCCVHARAGACASGCARERLRAQLDGSCSIKQRTKMVEAFNDPFGGLFAFLLSSKAKRDTSARAQE
eukprot:488378-Pleurochrysis_carterae.AAC.1